MARAIFLILLVFVSYVSCLVIVGNRPLVKVTQGLVRGTFRKTRNGRNISAFLDIPYAEPPVGELRFRNPVPKRPWWGLLDAVNNTAVCPQLSERVQNEDCLYLNVFTPWLLNQKLNLLPVMVFIHGGAFVSGSNTENIYGPDLLLDREVVLVVPNYRLGIFGFLSTGDDAAPGNFGLKDQTEALRWVQRNIRAFGGDPRKVTLFGQSAGGASVDLHALSDLSNGLFHRYITQSGTAVTGWAFNPNPRYSTHAKKVAQLYNCTTNTSASMVQCLRTLTIPQLLNTSSVFNNITVITGITWGPTNESSSRSAFLTDNPAKLLAQNKTKNYPFLAGIVKDEGLLVTVPINMSDTLYQLVVPNLRGFLIQLVEQFIPSVEPVKLADNIIQFYFNGNISSNKNVVLRQLTDFITDIFFMHPQIVTLRELAKTPRKPFYFYSFDYRGNFSLTNFLIGGNENVGVTHGDEVIYLFPFVTRMIPDAFSANDEKVVKLMLDLWTSFATNGVPTANITNPNIWKPYTTPYRHLRIGNDNDPTPVLLDSYYESRIRFWDENLSNKI